MRQNERGYFKLDYGDYVDEALYNDDTGVNANVDRLLADLERVDLEIERVGATAAGLPKRLELDVGGDGWTQNVDTGKYEHTRQLDGVTADTLLNVASAQTWECGELGWETREGEFTLTAERAGALRCTLILTRTEAAI